MKRRLLWSAARVVFACAALITLWTPGVGSHLVPLAAQSDPAGQIITEVNALRASLGLPAYQVDPALTYAAQFHAEWMAAGHRWSHTGAGGSSPQDRAAAAGYRGWVRENVASGTPSYEPSLVVYHWGQSPGHRPTMVSTDYVHIGVGYTRSDRDYDVYVLLAGYPSAGAPVLPAEGPVALGPIVAQPVQVSGPREDGSIVHVVQQWETAWDIAAAYGIAVEALLALNGLPDDPLIQPGDELIVQAAGADAVPPPAAGRTHTVQSGETAWTIAAIYGVPLEDLLAANGLGSDPLLRPGDRMTIPGGTPAAPGTTAAPPTAAAVQTATEPPTPSPTLVATATTVTATLPPTPSPPPPMPTLTPALEPEGEIGLGTNVLIGGVVIAIGVTIFAAMLWIELYERFGRRRR